jgi:hypothetical protein
MTLRYPTNGIGIVLKEAGKRYVLHYHNQRLAWASFESVAQMAQHGDAQCVSSDAPKEVIILRCDVRVEDDGVEIVPSYDIRDRRVLILLVPWDYNRHGQPIAVPPTRILWNGGDSNIHPLLVEVGAQSGLCSTMQPNDLRWRWLWLESLGNGEKSLRLSPDLVER